jgi:hypothetical protein
MRALIIAAIGGNSIAIPNTILSTDAGRQIDLNVTLQALPHNAELPMLGYVCVVF